VHYLRTALIPFLLLSINLSFVGAEVVEPEGIDWDTIRCGMRVGVNHNQYWRSNPYTSVVAIQAPLPFFFSREKKFVHPPAPTLLILTLIVCLNFAVLRLNTDLLGSTSNSASAPQIAAGL